MRNKHILSAFTLAEVLITLVIIGVIAAVTVPTLMKNTERREFVSALKKAHSVLSQSLYSMTRDSGYPIGDYEYLKNTNFIDLFSKYVNVMQKCNNETECFGASLHGYTALNGNNATHATSTGKAIITSDGLMFTSVQLNSSSSVYGISPEDKAKSFVRIIVDVNGQRKPNKYGLDTSLFYIIDGKGIIPAGEYSTSDCKRTGAGTMCAAKVLRENKISY